MPVTISDNIYAKCVPAMSIDGSRADGFSLNSIAPTNKDEIAAIFQNAESDPQWNLIKTLIQADFMGKACAQKINGMAEFLKGLTRVIDAKRMTTTKVSEGRYKVFPYVEMEVQNPVNNKTWWVSAGEVAASGETTPNTAQSFDWKVIVESPTNIPIDVRFFPPRTTVTINGRSGGGVEQVPIYKVLDAEVDGADLILYLDNISNNAADPFYSASATRRNNVVEGILTRGLPNVARREAYCPDTPALNTTQHKPFWLQESHRVVIIDDEVVRWQDMIENNNKFYSTFGKVPPVQAIKQAVEAYDEQTAWSFLRNPALANQTTNSIDQLESVEIYAGDANSNTNTFSGYLECRRANALGLAEQLIDCTDKDGYPSYIDNLGEKLDLQTLKQKLYRMMQIRRDNGGDAQTFQLWMDSRFREEMVDTFIAYFKNKGQDTLRINIAVGDLETKAFGFTVRKIKLDWPSVTLELVSHPSFDDRRDDYVAKAEDMGDDTFAFGGQWLLIPDWSTIYRAVFQAGNVTRKTGTTDQLAMSDSAFACVAGDVPVRSYQHFYELWSTVVECPGASRLFVNFDPSEFLLVPASS